MADKLTVLEGSSARLRGLVEPLTPAQLTASAYPTDWSVAQVVSHLGSSAVLMQQRLEDSLAGTESDPELPPKVWAVWDAKTPEAQAADGLAADRELLAALGRLSDDERAAASIDFGPITLDLDTAIGMRVNEHVLHTWDVATAFDAGATLPLDGTEVVVDNLAMIAGFAGKPTGVERTIDVRTTLPRRDMRVVLTAESVQVTEGDLAATPDVELPAEAFVRLVYGRLDPDHTPEVIDEGGALGELRAVFRGV